MDIFVAFCVIHTCMDTCDDSYRISCPDYIFVCRKVIPVCHFQHLELVQVWQREAADADYWNEFTKSLYTPLSEAQCFCGQQNWVWPGTKPSHMNWICVLVFWQLAMTAMHLNTNCLCWPLVWLLWWAENSWFPDCGNDGRTHRDCQVPVWVWWREAADAERWGVWVFKFLLPFWDLGLSQLSNSKPSKRQYMLGIYCPQKTGFWCLPLWHHITQNVLRKQWMPIIPHNLLKYAEYLQPVWLFMMPDSFQSMLGRAPWACQVSLRALWWKAQAGS